MLVYYMITGLLLPTMLVGFGAIFRSHPPKNINMAFGYRTSRSMKSRESWDFANRYWGALVFRIGLAAEGVTLGVLAAGYLAAPGADGKSESCYVRPADRFAVCQYPADRAAAEEKIRR